MQALLLYCQFEKLSCYLLRQSINGSYRLDQLGVFAHGSSLASRCVRNPTEPDSTVPRKTACALELKSLHFLFA